MFMATSDTSNNRGTKKLTKHAKAATSDTAGSAAARTSSRKSAEGTAALLQRFDAAVQRRQTTRTCLLWPLNRLPPDTGQTQVS